MRKRPRPSRLAGLLACAAVSLGGCGGGGDGAAADRAARTPTPTATAGPPGGEPGGSRQFRLEATLRCREARRGVRLPRTVPSGSRLKGYVGRARRRDGALLDAFSSVRPPDEATAAQVQALQGAYATLLPLYDRVLIADGRLALFRLRNGIRTTERAVSRVAASTGLIACGPGPP